MIKKTLEKLMLLVGCLVVSVLTSCGPNETEKALDGKWKSVEQIELGYGMSMRYAFAFDAENHTASVKTRFYAADLGSFMDSKVKAHWSINNNHITLDFYGEPQIKLNESVADYAAATLGISTDNLKSMMSEQFKKEFEKNDDHSMEIVKLTERVLILKDSGGATINLKRYGSSRYLKNNGQSGSSSHSGRNTEIVEEDVLTGVDEADATLPTVEVTDNGRKVTVGDKTYIAGSKFWEDTYIADDLDEGTIEIKIRHPYFSGNEEFGYGDVLMEFMGRYYYLEFISGTSGHEEYRCSISADGNSIFDLVLHIDGDGNFPSGTLESIENGNTVYSWKLTLKNDARNNTKHTEGETNWTDEPTAVTSPQVDSESGIDLAVPDRIVEKAESETKGSVPAVVTAPDPDPDKVWESVEQPPVFPGGEAAMMKFIQDSMRYPPLAKENGVQGTVVVMFVVTKTGQVGEVKVARSKDPDLDREAVRIINSMPRFEPGKQNGRPVHVWFTLPVRFKL